jgi:hypothetical protein
MYSGSAQAAVTQLRSEEQLAKQPRLPLPPPFDPLTLPLMQQAAMMQMHESHFARAVLRRLLVDSQDKPQWSDYKALVNLGFARKGAAEKWHKLTAGGAVIARELEQQLCKSLDIHAMLGPVGTAHTVEFSCPCGWRFATRNSHTAPGNARASWNRHHATAEGMQKLVAALRPPAKMESA